MVAKLTSSLAFIVPAAYFGNNARRHRRVSVALRSLGIRVAAFDAYLADFDQAKRQEIKIKMANVFFSGEISPDSLRTSSHKEVEKTLGLMSFALDRAEKLVE